MDYVLLFNAASMICANSGMSVDDYLGYDMIGAPMEDDEGIGEGGEWRFVVGECADYARHRTRF